MALWGADAEELGPEGWAGGEYGAVAAVSNYRLRAFLAGFRDAYAKVELKRPRLAGWSLSRMRSGRW